jgi:hypothetical protein
LVPLGKNGGNYRQIQSRCLAAGTAGRSDIRKLGFNSGDGGAMWFNNVISEKNGRRPKSWHSLEE